MGLLSFQPTQGRQDHLFNPLTTCMIKGDCRPGSPLLGSAGSRSSTRQTLCKQADILWPASHNLKPIHSPAKFVEQNWPLGALRVPEENQRRQKETSTWQMPQARPSFSSPVRYPPANSLTQDWLVFVSARKPADTARQEPTGALAMRLHPHCSAARP